ncbi:hypothetical protein [Streptomyces lavendulocolor]|uniref:hypothetical protein n=1 Tax=Streptomyces lavendulocolor TaxID=67316 RepID=UPI0033F32423
MDSEMIRRGVLASFERLPGPERFLLEHLCVYRWFRPDTVYYTATALRARVDTALFCELPMLEPRVAGSGTDDHRLRPLLRRHLLDTLREERPETYQRAHRLAAGYFHQALDPFHADTVGRYVEEIHHLAAANPGRAFGRVSTFCHTALLHGLPEAASRAAAEALKASDPPEQLVLLAEVVQLVAKVLASSARVDEQVVVRLDSLLVRSRPTLDLAASRITRLARDLVTYYSERLAPAPTMSVALAPDAVRGVDRHGMPEISAALAVAEAFAHFPHNIARRDHRVELRGRSLVRHAVRSTVVTRATGPQNTRDVIDLFPLDAMETVDALRLKDANGNTVTSLSSFETRTTIANAVSFWLTGTDEHGQDDGETVPVHREISRSLSSALHGMQHDAVGELLRTAAEETRGPVRNRITEATRYLPLVAQLDTRSGMSQTVEYAYDGPCAVRRRGFVGVEVDLQVVLPTEVRNHFTLPTPQGVELAGMGFSSAEHAVLEPDTTRSGWPQRAQEELPRQFTVRFPREDDEPAHRLTQATVHLLYVPHRKDIRRVRRVNLICLVICLAATFLPFLLDRAEWAGVLSVVGSGLMALDTYFQNRRQGTEGTDEGLRSFAARPLRAVLGVSLLTALLAMAFVYVRDDLVAFTLSMTTLGTCVISGLLLAGIATRRKGMLSRASEALWHPTARLLEHR